MKKTSRPLLGDVARAAGVSPALASLAMRDLPGPSEASRAAVLEAASRLGYRMNRAASILAKNKPHRIGAALNLAQAFHVDAVDHIYQVADRLGYDLLLGGVTENRTLDEATRSLVSELSEGILIVGMHVIPRQLLEEPHALPSVAIGNAPWSGQYDVVRTASDVGVRSAIDMLVDLGHRAIVHIDGGDHSGSDERRRGYLEGMRAHGLEQFIYIHPGGNSERDGLAASNELLSSHPETTAIICYNDSCAVGAVQAIEHAGLKIPGDISVVGYDDSPVAQMDYFALSTIGQDIGSLTDIAVSRLVAHIENPDLPYEEIVLPPRLIPRRTTGPVRHD